MYVLQFEHFPGMHILDWDWGFCGWDWGFCGWYWGFCGWDGMGLDGIEKRREKREEIGMLGSIDE